jgi:hypothetical protein
MSTGTLRPPPLESEDTALWFSQVEDAQNLTSEFLRRKRWHF